LRDQLAGLKKPIFTTDGALALPWFSTENGAPPFAIDPNFQEVARSREERGGIEGMLQRGEFPTVVLATTDAVYLKSLNAKYALVGELMQQGVRYKIYEFGAKNATESQQ
jgi:hypothetical protein